MATGTQERDEEDTSESETKEEGFFDKVIQSENDTEDEESETKSEKKGGRT